MTLIHDEIHKLWLNPMSSFYQTGLYIHFLKNKIIFFLNIALCTKLEKQLKHKWWDLRFISKRNESMKTSVKYDYCLLPYRFVMKHMRRCASVRHHTWMTGTQSLLKKKTHSKAPNDIWIGSTKGSWWHFTQFTKTRHGCITKHPLQRPAQLSN